MTKSFRWTTAIAVVALTVGITSSASGVLVDMAGHWSASLIAALEAKGIVAGDATGRFSPDMPLTRAQMAKLLVSGLGSQTDAELLSRYPSRFRDIPNWHWGKGYIEVLAESAITEGYPDGSFGPADAVTRAQMAVFLVRATGLAEQARVMRFEPSSYRDDHLIPEWARGAIHVALANGLMAGFEDRTFRPLQPITKAEGGVTLLRLLALRGEAFHVTGTLLQFDTATRQGVIRTVVGDDRHFVMASDAQYFRRGNTAAPSAMQLLDQVWLVLGPDGTGRFLEARYVDTEATNAVVQQDTVTVTTPQGNQRTYGVQRGASIFLNGRSATLNQIHGAARLYLAVDRVTGEVRVLDAVNAPLVGTVMDYDLASATLGIEVGGRLGSYSLSAEALLFLNGSLVNPSGLLPGDRVQVALDGTGRILYLQAER